MKHSFFLLLLLLSMTIPSLRAHAATEEQARDISWSDRGKASLEAIFSNNDSVDQFINELSPNVTAGDPPLQIGEFKIVDLNPSRGALSLICTLSDGGRFFPTLLVVTKVGGAFDYDSVYNGGGMDIPKLNDVVVTLNGAGQKGLLVPRLLGKYDGARPVAMAYDIYTLNDDRLFRADGYYPAFYENEILPALEAMRNSAQAASSSQNVDSASFGHEEATALELSIDYIKQALQTGSW